MIKISHAIGVNLLALFILTGYFDNMLDKTRNELFALQDKVNKINVVSLNRKSIRK